MNSLYENTIGRLVFRVILTIVAIVALILSFTGSSPVALYFTNWSVWFAAAMTFITIIGTFMSRSGNESVLDNGIYRLLKFAAEVMIFATFVVSSFVLPDKIWTSGFWTLGGAFKHCFLPLLFIADGILCDKRNSYKIGYVFFALVPPIAYWTAVIVRFVNYRNSIGGAIPEEQWDRYYPYGFTNIDDGHTLTFLICLLAGIAVALVITGFVFYALNRKRAKQNS
ncbi:MAG: hypothetical protein J6U54_11860 [Clostridiales bacterium]|nr:hypothetical protein [Clostridiales bacterium]